MPNARRQIALTRHFVAPQEYEPSSIQIVRWSEPPAMDTGAPNPALSMQGDSLFVAYVCMNPDFPGWDSAEPGHPGLDVYSAVLQFDGVTQQYLGPPSNESLHLHPLYGLGLSWYSFFEVLCSPRAVNDRRHWIATFHDETLEVVARAAKVAHFRVAGEDTAGIAADFATQGAA